MMEISAVSSVSFSRQISQAPQKHYDETSIDENDFKIFINDDEVTDFSLFAEQILAANDVNASHFPVIMDFLKINNFVDVRECYDNLGYTFMTTDINNKCVRARMIEKLVYLSENNCDLNLELLNFLRSLTFGGKSIKHSDYISNVNIIKTILPFCTNFFDDEKYWNKIRYFCFDTDEIKDALKYVIVNYGKEKNHKYIQLPRKNAYSLKHLSRNKVREIIWNKSNNSNIKRCNVTYYNLCKINLPAVLFKYINFLD